MGSAITVSPWRFAPSTRSMRPTKLSSSTPSIAILRPRGATKRAPAGPTIGDHPRRLGGCLPVIEDYVRWLEGLYADRARVAPNDPGTLRAAVRVLRRHAARL